MNYEFIREKSLVVTRDDDRSFFYAYFYAFRWFRNMSVQEQKDHIRSERKKLDVSKKEWREMDRTLAKTFRDDFRRFWDDPYPLPFITVKKIRALLSILSWLRIEAILDVDTPIHDQFIIDKFSETFISALENIESHELKTFSKEKKHLLQKCFMDVVLFLWNKTIDESFLRLLNNIHNVGHDIGIAEIPFVAPALSYNVVVLNERYEPYNNWTHDPTKEFIVIMLDDRGFHSIGSFHMIENTYKINRIFPSLDFLYDDKQAPSRTDSTEISVTV
jgi:hypothetical protein